MILISELRTLNSNFSKEARPCFSAQNPSEPGTCLPTGRLKTLNPEL